MPVIELLIVQIWVAVNKLGLIEGKKWFNEVTENLKEAKYFSENVKNLIGKQNIYDFNKWLVKLSKLWIYYLLGSFKC